MQILWSHIYQTFSPSRSGTGSFVIIKSGNNLSEKKQNLIAFLTSTILCLLILLGIIAESVGIGATVGAEAENGERKVVVIGAGYTVDPGACIEAGAIVSANKN